MKSLWRILFIVFLATNIYAFAQGSWQQLVDYFINMGPWGILATADLAMALIVAIVSMWRHARAKGANPVPFLVATLMTGSLGLLAYFAQHDDA